MSTPKIGRNARLIVNSVVIGYAKNISVEASAEVNKDYSMDSKKPALLESGNQTFRWSASKLWVDGSMLTLLLSGDKFNVVFTHSGSPPTAPYETWTNCIVTRWAKRASDTGGILLDVEGEGMDVTPTDG